MRARRPSLPVLAVCLSLGAALLGASPGRAVERTAFTPTASGRPVPVDGSAPWCTVCKAQRPILSDLCADPAYEDLVVFDVDFDSQTPALRTLRVTAQSTPTRPASRP